MRKQGSVELNKKIQRQAGACLFPFIAILLLFLAVPLVIMIRASFANPDDTGWTVQNYLTIMTQPFYYEAFKNSFLISFASSLAGIILAMFVAQALAQSSQGVQDRMMLFINMTANFAGVPLAFAFIILIGNAGILTLMLSKIGVPLLNGFNLYSWQGLAVTYVYFQVPLGVLFLYPAFRGIDNIWKEAALLLGAGPAAFWLRVGLPHILPSVFGTFIILFANAMGTYETAYALVGGNINLVTTRIAALVSGDIFAQPQLGSAMAVLFAVMMIAILIIDEYFLRLVRRNIK